MVARACRLGHYEQAFPAVMATDIASVSCVCMCMPRFQSSYCRKRNEHVHDGKISRIAYLLGPDDKKHKQNLLGITKATALRWDAPQLQHGGNSSRTAAVEAAVQEQWYNSTRASLFSICDSNCAFCTCVCGVHQEMLNRDYCPFSRPIENQPHFVEHIIPY